MSDTATDIVPPSLDELIVQVDLIIPLLRWHRKDGSLEMDSAEARDILIRLIRAAYSAGALDATREAGDRAVAVIDRAFAAAAPGEP